MFSKKIAEKLTLSENAVSNTLQLLDEGCTIPFISRYRKERTGGLDEVKIGEIANLYATLKDVAKRKETIVKTITEQGKMTPELQERIDGCWDANELEDIYLPYKPKRRTRAQIAREKGLEPLATLIMQQGCDPEREAKKFLNENVASVKDALQGAQDIIAENINEDERARQGVRMSYQRDAVIASKVVKAKQDSDEAQKYADYFDFSEPLRKCSSHRLLAMRRGEAEGILRDD